MTIHLVDIDHVGIAVEDLEGSVERYRTMLGVEPVHRERVEDQGVDEVLFAVACDMPYVTRPVAEIAVAAARRCDAAIPRHDGLFEPVCGAYRKSSLPAIVGALDAGNYTAHDVVELMDVTWLEGLDPAQFESLNTPADLERFNAALSAQR